jgi:hypothetical protein
LFDFAICDIKRATMYMANEPAMTPMEGIDTKIHLIRGQRVMLDSDLAAVYGVPTKRLNEQIKRNLGRFPEDFAFQLSSEELENMRSQIATASRRNIRYRPWAFTEHGAIMLASILNSGRAVEMSVFVVRAFVRMRELVLGNRQLAAKLDELESRVGAHDEAIAELVTAIRQLLEPPADQPRREIGFHIKEVAPRYRVRSQA